jgi:hypothetical protein
LSPKIRRVARIVSVSVPFHPGDRVKPGDVLGSVGDTGNAGGTLAKATS